jgi:uncharacterized protein (TIRG00374 family)
VAVAFKNLFTKRVLLFLGFGVTVFVLYFYFYVGTVKIADVLLHANLVYYISAFITFVLAIFFSCLAWRSLLSSLSVKTSVRRALLYIWVGLFFDVTIPEPGWSGDLSKAYMLAKTSQQKPGKIVASVVGHKIISMGITVFDLFLGLTLLAFHYKLPIAVLGFLAFVLFIALFSLLIVVYFSVRPEATKALLDWLIKIATFFRRSHWDPTKFRRNAEETLERFHEGIGTIGSERKAWVQPTILSLISWGFDVSVIFLVFAALGFPVPVDRVLIVYALTGTLQSVGISFVGFTELVMSTAYTVLLIPAAISVSATLLTRIITLWFKLIVSYAAFQYAGIKMLLDKTPPQPQNGTVENLALP